MNTIDNKKLEYYLAAWNLSNPQFLTQTLTGHFYTVTYETETVILLKMGRLPKNGFLMTSWDS